MSASHIIVDCLPSLCQKLSDLVAVWRNSNKINFVCFFETLCISAMAVFYCYNCGRKTTRSSYNLFKSDQSITTKSTAWLLCRFSSTQTWIQCSVLCQQLALVAFWCQRVCYTRQLAGTSLLTQVSNWHHKPACDK